MTTTNPFTDEQAQRAEALLHARKAIENTASKGPFAGGDRTLDLAYLPELLGVADWIVTGVRIEVRDEHPTHVAVHRISDGTYVEVSRVGEDPATFTRAVAQWPAREDAPPAEQYLHAKDADETRLCPAATGLATVFWMEVTCPDCQAAVAARTGTIDPGAERRAAEAQVPTQRATEQDQPVVVHHHVQEQEMTACGTPWATVARSTDDQSAVTCEACILQLHRGSRG